MTIPGCRWAIYSVSPANLIMNLMPIDNSNKTQTLENQSVINQPKRLASRFMVSSLVR